ncbi:MAG: hypothetical protein ACREBW_08350, partial [Candidatus Micrarchaeaceae archaeon]
DKERMTERDYMYYITDAMEVAVLHNPIQKTSSIMRVALQNDVNALKNLLVDQAFMLLSIQRRDEIRDNVMVGTIKDRLDADDGSTYLTIVGAYHTKEILQHLHARADVDVKVYGDSTKMTSLSNLEFAAMPQANHFIGTGAYQGYLDEAVEVARTFLGVGSTITNLKILYENTKNRIINELPDDNELIVGGHLVKHFMIDFAALMSSFPSVANQDAKELMSKALITANSVWSDYDPPESVRIQTFARALKRFATAALTGQCTGNAPEFALQIFKTEAERDIRKLARREERCRSTNVS